MDLDAIQLVSQALADSLKAAFADAEIEGDVYVGPLDDPGAQNAAAVLFLYRVAVNADLRSAQHRVPAADPQAPAVVFEGGLPLDLYYLLTAVPVQQNGELESLRALGCAMQAFNRQGALVGVPVGGETIRLTLDPLTCEEMSRIWTLFPTVNYRTSVAYLASPVWIDPPSVRWAGPPVIQEPHRVGPVDPGVAL